jgi:hypothetical protein
LANEKIRIEYVVDKKQLDASNKSLQDAQKQNNLTQKEVDETTAKYKKQDRELKGLGGTMKAVGGVLAGFFAVSKIIDFGKGVVNVTANFQKMEAVLTNTLGSTSKAKKAMDDLQKFAASTPFAVSQLTDSFIKLANRGLVLTQKEMTKMGDLSSALGKEFGVLTEAILDVNNTERWNELGIKVKTTGDTMVGTFKGISVEVDRTEAGALKMVEQFGEFKGVAGGMAAISKTAAGQISNLGDNFEAVQRNLGDRSSGLISSMLTLANDALGGIATAIAKTPVEKLREEQHELNVLVGALTEANISQESRNRLINKIQTEYPNYLGNLDAETATNEELRDRLIEVNNQFERKIALQVKEEALADIKEDLNNAVQRELELRLQISEAELRNEAVRNGSARAQRSDAGLIEKLLTAQNEAIADQTRLTGQLEEKVKLVNEALGLVDDADYFTDKPAEAIEKTNAAVSMTAKQIKDVAEGMKEALKLAKEFDSLDSPDLIVDIQTRTTGSFDNDARLESIQDFEDKKLEIKNESREEGFLKETEDQIAHYENLDELAEENARKQRELAYSTAQSIFDTLLMFSDYKIAVLEEAKNKELEMAGDNKVRQAEIEKEFGEKIKAEKLKAFKIQKAANILTATMNTALGVSAALTLPPPANFILAPIVGALGAAQVSIIAATPPPKFEKGGRIGGKLHRHGGTLIEAELDEHVINRKATAKYGHGLFDKINNLELHQDILSGKSGGSSVNIVDTTPIAKALAGQTQSHISIDEEGFTLKQQKNQTTMIQKLKRYST